MPILIKNIRGLAGCYEGTTPPYLRGSDLGELPILGDAFLAIDEGRIAHFGPMSEWEGIADWRGLTVIDADGRYVLPAWCDPHTHLVFAASREREFEDRIHGLSYEQIAARGGGILQSAERLGAMPEDALFEAALQRLHRVRRMGTGAIEIKTGYGLTTDSELKMLRVIQRLREATGMCIKATFLGAHAVPKAYKNNKQGYIDLLLGEMIPAVAAQGVADYIDVFCESGYFDVQETLRIVQAGATHGLKARIHVNQFNALGAIPSLVAEGVISVDHLEVMQPTDFNALAGSATIATALPLCSLFLGIPYTPARELVDRGAIVALATDYNPGSAPAGNMNLAVSLACMHLRLTPHEAINAATINAAAALECTGEVGVIATGARANVLITEPCESLAYLPYSFGSPALDGVVIDGEVSWLSETL